MKAKGRLNKSNLTMKQKQIPVYLSDDSTKGIFELFFGLPPLRPESRSGFSALLRKGAKEGF